MRRIPTQPVAQQINPHHGVPFIVPNHAKILQPTQKFPKAKRRLVIPILVFRTAEFNHMGHEVRVFDQSDEVMVNLVLCREVVYECASDRVPSVRCDVVAFYNKKEIRSTAWCY